MTEHFGYFDAILDSNGHYDREYNAQQWTEPFRALVTTGVMKGAYNQLEVTANGANMVSSVKSGIAFIEGRYYYNDALVELTHDTEVIGMSRIDRIVVRMDTNTEARHVKTFIKKGVPSTNPMAPTLTQTQQLYEISLAQVRVVGGQTFVAANAVTDERGKNVICPWAGSNILPNFSDSSLGQPNGISTLDASGQVPLGQLGNVPLPKDGSTTQKGIVQFTTSLTSTSNTLAPTASALKSVNDKLISTFVAIGEGATAVDKAVAIGKGAKANENYGLALGESALSQNKFTVALGTSAEALNIYEGILGTPSYTKDWKVPGSFSVLGTKNFEMPHPHPDKKATHVIRHGAVESPTAGDTLYRYSVEALTDGETVELLLPDYFQHLNKDIDVYVSPHLHFGRAFGMVEGDILKVTCEKAGHYKVLVIGTRNDDHESVQNWYIKGVEREIGESWNGETYVFEVDEILEVTEIEEVIA